MSTLATYALTAMIVFSALAASASLSLAVAAQGVSATSNVLGGLNLDDYCALIGYDHSDVVSDNLTSPPNVGPNAAYDWACIAADGSALPSPYRISRTFNDMYLPCDAQYPNKNAAPELGDPNDAYTWNCIVSQNVDKNGNPLPNPGGYIVGLVCLSSDTACQTGNGNGVANAVVNACAMISGTPACEFVASNANGFYQIGDLPPGLYSVTADPPPGTLATSQEIDNVPVGDPSTTTENMVLPVISGTSTSGIEGTTGNPPTISGSLSSYTFDTFGCPGGTFSYSLTLAQNVYTSDSTIPAGKVLASGPMTQVSVAGGVVHFQAVHSGSLDPAHGKANLVFSFNCPGLGSGTSGNISIYIDPSGVVVNQAGRPVAGATVTLYYSPIDDTGPYSQVANGSSTMSPGNRNNPVTTGPDGTFGWDVLPGYYKVVATRPGCTGPDLDTSPALTIPPAVTDLTITLQCSDTRQPVVKILVHPDEETGLTSALFVLHGFKPSNGNGKANGDDQGDRNSRAADAHLTYQCKLDNGVFTACNGVVFYHGLTPGTHTFVVHATDGAGNTSNDVSYTWNVVTTRNDHH